MEDVLTPTLFAYLSTVELVLPEHILRNSLPQTYGNPTSSTSFWLCTTGKDSLWKLKGHLLLDLLKKTR